MKAIILAAGLGTRLQPFTLHHPKALAMVNGKSLLQRNVEYLQKHGITELIVNVHHFANQIIDTIEENKGWGSNISISDETDEVLETGGGLKRASWYFKGEKEFIVMNVDILTDLPLQEMVDTHSSNKPLATLAITDRNSSRALLFNHENNLCGWKNLNTLEEKGPVTTYKTVDKESLSPKAFSGIHIISSSIFPLIEQSGKFSIIDVYLNLCANHTIKGFNHSNSLLIDVGKPESITKAEELFY